MLHESHNGQLLITSNNNIGATTRWPTSKIVTYGGASSAGYRSLLDSH